MIHLDIYHIFSEVNLVIKEKRGKSKILLRPFEFAGQRQTLASA